MKNKKGTSRSHSRNKATAHREGQAGGDRLNKLPETGGDKLNKLPEAGGDRLSKLPDDILLNILERVDTMDALRTCILSKRMLKLRAMLSWFDINIASLWRIHKASPHTTPRLVRYNHAVAAVTEKILSARNAEVPVRKLRVQFFLRRDEFLSISKAVARAMSTQKVEDAEFMILTQTPCLSCTSDDLLCHAKKFNSWFGDCPAAFAGLTRLWLRNMRFGELDIPNILSTCKQLESLRLSYCDAGVCSVLQLEHAQLVELHIGFGKFEAVHLNCLPRLQRVNYTCWSYQDPLTFGSAPQLSELNLENIGISSTKNLQLSELLANVSWIKDLRLDFKSEKIWVLPECPKLLAPVLGELQIVNLDNLPEGCDIAWTMFIIEAAPSLKELCISVWDNLCKMVTNKDLRRKNGYCEKTNVEWQPSAVDFKHKNLVKLTIYGFQPDENFVRYVRRIMEVAVNIKEISLHDRKVCESCVDLDPSIKLCPSRYPRTSEEKDMLREEITKELQISSPAVIHFRS